MRQINESTQCTCDAMMFPQSLVNPLPTWLSSAPKDLRRPAIACISTAVCTSVTNSMGESEWTLHWARGVVALIKLIL